MRLAVIQPPRKKPKRCIASYPYCEHEGMNRHDEGRTTDSVRWYKRIKKSAIYFTADDLCVVSTAQHPLKFSRERVVALDAIMSQYPVQAHAGQQSLPDVSR